MPRRHSALISRGEIWDADIPGVGKHPVVVITRDSALSLVTSVVCVPITSSVHGHVAEIEVGREEGLNRVSSANCDNIFTLPKTVLTRRRGRLGPSKSVELDRALMVALGLA